MAEKNIKESIETDAYKNIKNMLKLKEDDSLSVLLKNFREGKRRIDYLLKVAQDIENEVFNASQQSTESEEIAENYTEPQTAEEPEFQPQADITEEPLIIEQEAKPAAEPVVQAEKSAVKPDEKTIEKRTDITVDKSKKPVDKPEKKEPVIRRINLEEIERKYGSSGRGPRPERPFTPRPGGFNNGPNNDSRPPRPYPPRPAGATGGAPRPGGFAKPVILDTPVLKNEARKIPDKKKDASKTTGEGKKTMNKRTLIRKGFIETGFDEERMGSRKLVNKKNKDILIPFVAQKIEKAVITTENLTVKILSEKIGKPATEIIKQLMVLGFMTNINSVVDFPTMELVANELGVEIELKLDKTKEEVLADIHEDEDKTGEFTKRPPIVTVMGHVDHGKTSLLDALKKTNVAESEAGGITQHIGAYTISIKNEKITFIDTPGHEAFTAMRARGAKVTDIAILVVAADDGVMPQTVEAINHAKAANVPVIVAINKIDRQGANPDKIKQQLTEHGILPEEWGGDAIIVPVSAKTREGLDKLLESILLVAEVQELKANPERKAKGTIVEAKLDKGKGPVATVIINTGTLKIGDVVVSGTAYGKIRAMQDDKGRMVKEALPSYAVAVIGLSEVPNAGDIIYVVDDEKLAKQVSEERAAKLKNEQIGVSQNVSLDDMFSRISEEQLKSVNIIVKADTQGSVEALKASLNKLTNEEVKVRTIHGGVGAVNKSDIMLADASKAIIIGFNVRADSNETKALADETKVDIREYRIIYDALDGIEATIKGMREPTYHETATGKLEVRNVFKITGAGTIAGCYVLSGKILRNAKVRVVRDGGVVFEGGVESLKRFKDDVKEVASGYECGVSIQGFNDVKEGDILEAYIIEKDA